MESFFTHSLFTPFLTHPLQQSCFAASFPLFLDWAWIYFHFHFHFITFSLFFFLWVFLEGPYNILILNMGIKDNVNGRVNISVTEGGWGWSTRQTLVHHLPWC